MVTQPQVLSAKKGMRKKLILGVASATAAAIVGSAGVAAAQSLGPTETIPSKAACADYTLYHFKNHGQCVSAYEHALGNGHGHGYGYGSGSNNQVNTAVTVSVNGNNNTVDVIINYFFG